MEYRYPLLEPLVSWPEYRCTMASLNDLACMKLAAVAQRGSKKDFVDLYALVLKHRPLEELFRLYQRKYQAKDISHLLYALTYFGDAEDERLSYVLWEVEWEEIKEAIRRWVKDAAR